MSENIAANIAVQIVDLLAPLTSEERQRSVSAALTLLGETQIKATVDSGLDEQVENGSTLNPRSDIWMKQNDLTMGMLETVFHFHQGDVELIAHDVPGNTASAKVRSVYILCGLMRLFLGGTPTFEDNLGREICTQLGCYDHTNHSKRVKDFGNIIAGNKNKGWTLTAPGLKKAGDLIKEIVSKTDT